MKIKLLLVLLSAISLVFCSFMPYQSGPPSPYYYTGSPSDNHSCASCHGNASTVSGWVTSNIPASGYVPGTVYQITATNSISGSGKYGFELSPQSTSGTYLGTLAAGSNSKLVGSKWITQTSASNSVTSWTFNWTAPVAGTGSVTFYASFARSTGSATKLSTLVVSEQSGGSLPAAAGPISGNTTVCKNSSSTYTVGTIAGATSYSWTVPAGASITSGQGTTSIVVNFGGSAVSGNISVYGTNGSGSGPASNLAVTVNSPPSPSGAISGNAAPCEASTQSYTVPITNGVTYTWSLPDGSSILSGQGTNSISALIGNTSGSIGVIPSNTCGNGTGSNFSLLITLLPGIPEPVSGPALVDLRTVTSSSYTTTGATNATSYHWDLTPVEAGTVSGDGLTCTVTWNTAFTGTASVRVKALNSCGDGSWSNEATVQLINTTGLTENSTVQIPVYPSPCNGQFNIDLTGINGKATASILNLAGKLLYSTGITPDKINFIQASLTKGMYILVIETNEGTSKSKLIIQ